MSITELKAKFHELIDSFENLDELQEWYDQMGSSQSTSPNYDYDDLNKMPPALKASLERAVKRIENGEKGIPHEEVMKRIKRKWD